MYYFSDPPGQEDKEAAQQLWVYRDPHGAVQGPFAGSAMFSWFLQGFMHDQELPTARAVEGEEEAFRPLREWVEEAGRPR